LLGGRVVLLADGMPQAIARETARRQDARMPAYALIVAAGIFEVAYLLWRTRRARRRLEQHLAKERGARVVATSGTPLTALLILCGAIALAFAVLATLTALG